MPRTRLIPDDNPELHAEILKRSGEGQSNENIASWLSAHLSNVRGMPIRVGRRQVLEFLKTVREERRPAAEAAIIDQVSKTVGADLRAVDRLLADAQHIQDIAMPRPIAQGTTNTKSFKGKRPNLALKAMETQRRLLELRFNLLGINKPEDKPKPAFALLPAEQPNDTTE